MNKPLVAGNKVVIINDETRRGFLVQQQPKDPNFAAVLFDDKRSVTVIARSELKRIEHFKVLASKTYPHDEDYSPAFIDDAYTFKGAFEKYRSVRDYPYTCIEYHDVNGDTWDISPQQVPRRSF
jgi:hypothetical protein